MQSAPSPAAVAWVLELKLVEFLRAQILIGRVELSLVTRAVHTGSLRILHNCRDRQRSLPPPEVDAYCDETLLVTGLTTVPVFAAGLAGARGRFRMSGPPGEGLPLGRERNAGFLPGPEIRGRSRPEFNPV